MKTFLFLNFLGAILTVLINSRLATASEIDVRSLEKKGEIIKLSQLLEKINKNYLGRIINIELRRNNNRLIYDLQIIDSQGVIWKLSLDAKTGTLLQRNKE